MTLTENNWGKEKQREIAYQLYMDQFYRLTGINSTTWPEIEILDRQCLEQARHLASKALFGKDLEPVMCSYMTCAAIDALYSPGRNESTSKSPWGSVFLVFLMAGIPTVSCFPFCRTAFLSFLNLSEILLFQHSFRDKRNKEDKKAWICWTISDDMGWYSQKLSQD